MVFVLESKIATKLLPDQKGTSSNGTPGVVRNAKMEATSSDSLHNKNRGYITFK